MRLICLATEVQMVVETWVITMGESVNTNEDASEMALKFARTVFVAIYICKTVFRMPRTEVSDLEDGVAQKLFTDFLGLGPLLEHILIKPTPLWSQVWPHRVFLTELIDANSGHIPKQNTLSKGRHYKESKLGEDGCGCSAESSTVWRLMQRLSSFLSIRHRCCETSPQASLLVHGPPSICWESVADRCA